MKKTYLFLLVATLSISATFAQKLDPKDFKQLSYRFIGPDGNRAIAIAGEPGNNNVVYIGAASGGIFKTDDAGVTWKPIFDDQEVSSIGALALAPKFPKQVWAGTGETFVIRPAHSLGDGIYKSSDAGKTWKNMGLAKSGRIGRVIVSPRDTNTVFACALGHTYGPQKGAGFVSHQKTAAKAGSRYFSSTNKRGPTIWRSIPKILTSSSPGCGTSTSTPGA